MYDLGIAGITSHCRYRKSCNVSATSFTRRVQSLSLSNINSDLIDISKHTLCKTRKDETAERMSSGTMVGSILLLNLMERVKK